MADQKSKHDCSYWTERWEKNQIGFHKSEVHPMLLKHQEKLCANGKPKNVFVPLCGKSIDLKWLADQGIETAGLDVAKTALEQFFTDSGLAWDEAPVPLLGATGQLLSSKDGKLKLYCGDMMKFSSGVGGTFDAIWDRASLVALDRADIKRYAQILKSILKPGGRMMVELLQYDLSIMEDVMAGPTKPPPPFPTYEEDLKVLYEPECFVEFVDQEGRTLQGKDIVAATYLVTKK
ncbi:thiopurine S-methyltransferase [Elysia marginata]|uniref:thiopurine S-methyltransferase n=1 Tax=Elysia marginata TaxID=1093978 RepID=A0AAV4E9S8_9GAST|nr:thiopurine S-methyltransferase [Elysia marginata]